MWYLLIVWVNDLWFVDGARVGIGRLGFHLVRLLAVMLMLMLVGLIEGLGGEDYWMSFWQ